MKAETKLAKVINPYRWLNLSVAVQYDPDERVDELSKHLLCLHATLSHSTYKVSKVLQMGG